MASLAESEKIVGDTMKTPIKEAVAAPYKGIGLVSVFTTAEARDEVEANAFTMSSLKSAQQEIAEEEETKQAQKDMLKEIMDEKGIKPVAPQ